MNNNTPQGGNFFASDIYLNAVFDHQQLGLQGTRHFENAEIDGHVVRTLVLKDFTSAKVMTQGPLLDYHLPLAKGVEVHHRGRLYAPCVAVDTVAVDEDAIREDGQLLVVGKDGRKAPYTGAVAPFVKVNEFDSFEQYCELWLANHDRLGDRQRRRKKAEKDLGGLVFTAEDPDEYLIRQAFDWKRAQFGDVNAALSDDTLRFIQGMRKDLRVSSLRTGHGQVLAVWVGWIHEGAWSGWIYSFNPDPFLSKYSPGWLLVYFMLEEAFKLKLREFDFSIGGEAYKWYFATHARLCASVGRPPLLVRAKSLARRLLRR